MKKNAGFVIIAAVVFLALLPIGQQIGGYLNFWPTNLLSWGFLAALNSLAWGMVLVFFLEREKLFRKTYKTARKVGADDSSFSLEELIESLSREVDRKDVAFSLNLVEKKIASQKELSESLEQIVEVAFRLLDAESVELALFDSKSGLYHSSFVLGRPFRASAQAMLSGAAENNDISAELAANPGVIVQPIAFAGSILGTLRIALPKGRLPLQSDRDVIAMLAIQSSVALINANYTAQLVKMRKISDETVKAKTGFLANLSHEIRGPLGIILNAVELVEDGLCGEITSDQKDVLGMAKKNGEHLLELINDVLDYAKIESGRLPAKKDAIVVNELLKDLTKVVRAQAETKSHKLNSESISEILAVSCDRRHIRQMLINFLTNAIKYTPEGGEIKIWAERIPANRIKISVSDNGIGIESSNRDKVFEAFERIDHSYSMSQLGTGLGMALTRRLAEVNGGSVDFSSEPGKGSQFWVILPAVKAPESTSAHAVSEKTGYFGQGEEVLVIAQEGKETNMVARFLVHSGFKVLKAINREEAVSAINQGTVELVLLDNDLLEKDEIDLINALRQDNSNPAVPIILLSTRGFVFDIEKYLKAGVDRCVTKPVELKKLAEICRELIDRKSPISVTHKDAAGSSGDSSLVSTLVDDNFH